MKKDLSYCKKCQKRKGLLSGRYGSGAEASDGVCRNRGKAGISGPGHEGASGKGAGASGFSGTE